MCAGGQSPPPDQPLTCVGSCQVKPAFAELTPKLSYQWGGQVTSPWATDVMMTPLVIQLDDDDCDGKVTARDIPEIVFSTFTGGQYGGAGVLHAISIVGGAVKEKWAVPGIHPTRHLAGGNLDGATGSEVVGCGNDGRVHAIRGDGTELWALSALHGIRIVTAWVDGPSLAEKPGRLAQWRTRLDALRKPVG